MRNAESLLFSDGQNTQRHAGHVQSSSSTLETLLSLPSTLKDNQKERRLKDAEFTARDGRSIGMATVTVKIEREREGGDSRENCNRVQSDESEKPTRRARSRGLGNVPLVGVERESEREETKKIKRCTVLE